MKAHTDKSYDAQLDDLRNKLLMLGGKVETEIATSMRALTERDSTLAESAIGQDRDVNRLEIEIDEACLRMLALRQPAASDLRFISAALKIVTDLERIGDLAVSMAERAMALSKEPAIARQLTSTPIAARISSIASTSRMRGTLATVTSSSVRRALARIGRAPFLFPAGTMVPDNGTPPSMTNFSMSFARGRRPQKGVPVARRWTSVTAISAPEFEPAAYGPALAPRALGARLRGCGVLQVPLQG